MKDLKYRQEKIQKKRKNTSWKIFVKEIASWFPINLYRNNGLISIFPETDRIKNIVDSKIYNDKYISTLEGLDYDGEDFINNFGSLFRNHKKPNITKFGRNENCEFANYIFGANNIYLSFVVGDICENVFYSTMIYSNCKNIFNSVMVVNHSNNIFSSFFISESYSVFYSKNIHNSSDIRYSENLIGCHNCIKCNNLENKSYYIENKKYTKQEYKKYIKKLKKGAIYSKSKLKNMASSNVSGSIIYKSSNIKNGLCINKLHNGKNVAFIGGGEDSNNFYDTFEAGENSNNFYGVEGSGTNSSHLYCSVGISQNASNIYYSYHLDSCSYCLGCIGLRNKSFCILNKQYSKDERFQLADKIFEQMDKDGILGDFFPGSMNPFYFNDTAAYLIDDSFTKEEVEAEGYLRRDDEIKVDIPEGLESINSSDLNNYQGFDSNGNRTINPDILKKVIIDKKGNYYRVIKMEYDFLIKYGLPLPEIHWLDRIKLGFKFK